MENYERFAVFYDAVMGDRKKTAQELLRYIQKLNPKAKKVLELACGTGSVLEHLPKKYKIWGLDLSSAMLSVARNRLPRAHLTHQNMVSFRFQEKFDVIYCVFDSINHVLRFSDWKKMFANVSRHLEDGGLFIFDVNMRKKLDRHIAEPARIHEFGGNYMVMKVYDGGQGIADWHIKVFENKKRSQFQLHEEVIQEIAVPREKIETALKQHFSHIEGIDRNARHPVQAGENLLFVCRL